METKEKKSNVGYLVEVNLNNYSVLNIFTKAGNFRGGKIYSEDKFFIILSGKTKLITINNSEKIEEIVENNQLIKIKKNIPNIFYFEEDTVMLEWFPKDVKKEKYDDFYKMKEKM